MWKWIDLYTYMDTRHYIASVRCNQTKIVSALYHNSSPGPFWCPQAVCPRIQYTPATQQMIPGHDWWCNKHLLVVLGNWKGSKAYCPSIRRDSIRAMVFQVQLCCYFSFLSWWKIWNYQGRVHVVIKNTKTVIGSEQKKIELKHYIESSHSPIWRINDV